MKLHDVARLKYDVVAKSKIKKMLLLGINRNKK